MTSHHAGQIMNLTGPIEPAELGLTDAHEHLFLKSLTLPSDVLGALQERG